MTLVIGEEVLFVFGTTCGGVKNVAVESPCDELYGDHLILDHWIRDALVELSALKGQALLIPIFLLLD